MLWIKQADPNNDFEIYGMQPGDEKIKDWLTYEVLLMNSQGKHKMIKVCILEGETVQI